MVSNRFNIKPGYMWDGVDKSNGYEQRYLKAINEKQKTEFLKYKYIDQNICNSILKYRYIYTFRLSILAQPVNLLYLIF